MIFQLQQYLLCQGRALNLRLSPTEIGYDHLVVAVPLNVHSVLPELYRERLLKTPKINAVPPAGRKTRIKSAENRERNCSTCTVCGHLKFLGAFKKYHQNPYACIVPLEERGEHRYQLVRV
jgi:hypothetical protein